MHQAPVLWALDLQVNKMVVVSASSWPCAHKWGRPCGLPPCEALPLEWRLTQELQTSVGQDLHSND